MAYQRVREKNKKQISFEKACLLNYTEEMEEETPERYRKIFGKIHVSS